MTLDIVRAFHRRMAAMIDAVRQGIRQEGAMTFSDTPTDYAFGQQRGVPTLVLKSKDRPSYVRLHWDTVMGDGAVDLQAVETTIRTQSTNSHST